jgi:hypothetical protein
MEQESTLDQAKRLLDRTSDGCSAAPDLNFRSCCEEHDLDYRNSLCSRKEADLKLRRCLQKKGWKVLPWLYWCGVRLFGGSHYGGKK